MLSCSAMRWFLILLLLPFAVGADSPEPAAATPEARDAALVKAFRYLDEKIWTLQDGGP